MDLQLEINKDFVEANTTFFIKDQDGNLKSGGFSLMVTPPLNEDYWLLRVKLHGDQAVLGFPKFGAIGIGFAQEEDWNTNLPYTQDAEHIYNHIKHNKKYDEITDEQCIEAIKMISAAALDWAERAMV